MGGGELVTPRRLEQAPLDDNDLYWTALDGGIGWWVGVQGDVGPIWTLEGPRQ